MRTTLTLFALPLALLVACGDKSEPGPGVGSGGSAAPQGGSTSGGAPGMSGAATMNGGSTSGAANTGGATNTGGAATTGGAAAGATTSSKGGNAGAPAAGASGSGATAGSGGASGAKSTGGGGGTSNGGSSAGAGGAPTGGSGGGSATGCSRELLQKTLDAYFAALAAHDSSSLPLASSVKFTENGKSLQLGKDGLWKSAGMVKYSQTALDTQTCNSASHAVVPDGSTDIPLALRIKLQDQKITEVETIAARAGDYKAVSSNPAAIIASKDTVKWEEVVPADQRNTRAEITAWIDKYFRVFPSGVCNTASSCRRLENGGGNFSCSGGASCMAGTPTGTPNLNPRLLLADVERGIGVGFTVYQGHTDMHMYKMYGDQIYAVHALLAMGSAGWD